MWRVKKMHWFARCKIIKANIMFLNAMLSHMCKVFLRHATPDKQSVVSCEHDCSIGEWIEVAMKHKAVMGEATSKNIVATKNGFATLQGETLDEDDISMTIRPADCARKTKRQRKRMSQKERNCGNIFTFKRRKRLAEASSSTSKPCAGNAAQFASVASCDDEGGLMYHQEDDHLYVEKKRMQEEFRKQEKGESIGQRSHNQKESVQNKLEPPVARKSAHNKLEPPMPPN